MGLKLVASMLMEMSECVEPLLGVKPGAKLQSEQSLCTFSQSLFTGQPASRHKVAMTVAFRCRTLGPGDSIWSKAESRQPLAKL